MPATSPTTVKPAMPCDSRCDQSSAILRAASVACEGDGERHDRSRVPCQPYEVSRFRGAQASQSDNFFTHPPPLMTKADLAKASANPFARFPDPKLHNKAETLVCIEIRTKVARYCTKLIATAEKAGKLPSAREFMHRAFEFSRAANYTA